MSDISAEELARIDNLPKLVDLLRDHLDWPLEEDDFDEITYAYEPHELGLKDEDAAKVREVFQLRPLVTNQPWGVFFVSFDEKQLSVTVLRRILRALVVTKRGESKSAEHAAWDKSDLIFAANFGKSGERELAFVHFSDGADTGDLPVMKVLGWNAKDTKLHNDYAAKMLTSRLAWPDDQDDDAAWRKQWSGAFEIGHRQVIKTSRDLALHLAGLATQIRARANELLEAEADDGPMRTMLEAFRKNLIHDLDEDGFADMFAQTICYGMLAAAISRPSGALVADNMADMVPRTNPFLKELFANFLKLGGRDKRSNLDFDELGVREVVDMLQRADMPAVLRDFGDRNPKEDPVIHFYELFLKEYDPDKRMQRGVFYTPRPVVNFIVRGVDEILRTEFDLVLGLADTTTWGELAERNEKITVPDHIDPDQPFVQILDPATGTGTFLVEVIDLINKRMVEHWQGEGKSKIEIAEAWNEYVPAHLLPRLTAFELMMAPYSIAHMKVGLKLTETGYKFGSDERARIFLTNALEPAKDLNMQFDFMSAALAHEAKAANKAKSAGSYTAIIGNPPYANFGQLNQSKFISDLLADYKVGLNERKLNLDDDYIKFIRIAQKFASDCGNSIIGMITNHSYLDGVTHRQMRKAIAADFSMLMFLNLNGSVRRAGEISNAVVDENVFDIQQGVSILFLAKSPVTPAGEGHLYGSLIADRETKFDRLLSSLPSKLIETKIQTRAPLFLFVDRNLDQEEEFESFLSLKGLLPNSATGVKTHLDASFVAFDASQNRTQIDQLASSEPEGDASKRASLAKKVDLVRAALKKEDFEYRAYSYRPFDKRSVFYSTSAIPAGDHRYPIMRHFESENIGFSTVRQTSQGVFHHALAFDGLADMCYLSTATKECAYFFPMWLQAQAGEAFRRPNIDRDAADLLAKGCGLSFRDGIPRGEQQSMGADYRNQKAEQIGLLDQPWDGRGDLEKDFGPRDLFDWIYAILHAPSYRSRYAEFLKSDFPRIPIPKDRDTLASLVPLGRRLVALHLLKPEEDLVLKNPDIRFAGTGEARVEKGYPKYTNGKVEINEKRWFEDVPKETWEFHVGGYQVCEKWLKDRAGKGGKNPRPGRVLTEEDILHYRRVVTALTESRTIMAEIDKAIEEHGGWPGAFAIGTDTEEGE